MGKSAAAYAKAGGPDERPPVIHLWVALVTGIGGLLGLLIWVALRLRCGNVRSQPDLILPAVLTVGLMCRAALLTFTPTFYAPDEQPHYKYIAYLAEHRSLPVQASRTESPSNDWEYYQPPLYYLLLAPIYSVSQSMSLGTGASVRLLRLPSIALLLVTIFFASRFLSMLRITDPYLRGITIGMVGLLPTYTFLSSVINNDNLLIALGSIIFSLLVRPRITFWVSILIALLTGLALWTKMTAAVYTALIVLALAGPAFAGGKVKLSPFQAAVSLAVAAVLWAPLGWRNWMLYHSITGEGAANVRRAWPSLFYAVAATTRKLLDSFWAVSGLHNDVRGLFPVVGWLVSALAASGLIYCFWQQWRRGPAWTEKQAGLLIGFVGAILVNLGIAIRFSLLYGQSQGRFLFPMLAPIALGIAVGLKCWPFIRAKEWSVHVTGFFITYAIMFTCYSLARFAQMSSLKN